jgi:CRP-like cAMP-binding protein
MNQDFKDAFNRFRFLKIQDLITLFGICSFKSFKKGEILVSEGEFCKYTYLIRRGIVRTYVINVDGDERTIRLTKEKDFSAPSECFLNGKPSTEYLQAVEDCKVIALNTEKLNKLGQDNIRILKLVHEGTKEAFNEAIHRIEFFTTLTAEERYKKLLKEAPDLIQRVPQKYLASYLGVTTVSLSRIRNR